MDRKKTNKRAGVTSAGFEAVETTEFIILWIDRVRKSAQFPKKDLIQGKTPGRKRRERPTGHGWITLMLGPTGRTLDNAKRAAAN